MIETELLTVEQSLDNHDIGVLISPDFAVPNTPPWKDCSIATRLETPDGVSRQSTATLKLMHLNIPSISALDKRWRIALTFPDLKTDDVPIGTRVYVSETDSHGRKPSPMK